MLRIKNNPIEGAAIKHKGLLAGSTWSLCVGAGVSTGLVPVWPELTRRVVNQAFSISYTPAEFDIAVKDLRWSLDALLQGAANELNQQGKPAETFADLLETALYEDLLTVAKSRGLDAPLRDFLNNPRWLRKAEVQSLINLFETEYSASTLVQLARSLAQAKEANKGPHAIINFNADTLLYALLDTYLIHEHSSRIGRWEHPPYSYVKALRGIDGVTIDATPIFHCHGAVTPSPSGTTKKSRRRDSRDHLVFTEADYLSIAGNVATWAQSLFLFHAQCSRLLIVGHSLADPNIRKWLAWSLSSSIAEMGSISSSSEVSPRHIWIARKPKDPTLKKIQEISLLHLGVRVCWIEEWSDVAKVMNNLLAL